MLRKIGWGLGLLLGLSAWAHAAGNPPAPAAPPPVDPAAIAQQGGELLDRLMPPAFKALWLDNSDGLASLHACEAYVSPEALKAWRGLLDFPFSSQPTAIMAYLPDYTSFGQDIFQAVRQDDGKWKVTHARGSVVTGFPGRFQALIQSCLAHFGEIDRTLVYAPQLPSASIEIK